MEHRVKNEDVRTDHVRKFIRTPPMTETEIRRMLSKLTDQSSTFGNLQRDLLTPKNVKMSKETFD